MTAPASGSPSDAGGPATRAPALTAWLDRFFARYYRERPVDATFIGVHDGDARLPDCSEAGLDGATGGVEALLRDLQALPPEPLTPVEALDRRLAAGALAIERWELGSAHFQRGNPAYYTGEAVFGVIALFLRPFAPLPERVAAATARMMALPALLDQGRRNLRRAPLAWTERALRDCAGARAFFTGGIDRLIAEHGIADERFRAAAGRAAAAFADFASWLRTALASRPIEDYACGEEAFDLLLRQGHFLDRSADDILAYARAQFADSAAWLAAHAGDVGARTPDEALAHLADLHPPVEGYYARYEELWAASRALAEQRDLLTWPDYPLRYVPQPAWAREAAPHLYFLSYRSPAPFDALPVVDYLVTPVEPTLPAAEQQRRLRATNDSVIKLNHVVHHGGIGHHVQNWHAMRARSRIGRVAAVDCASRIAHLCGGTMAEGWACYATDLMDEAGFLTPLERYAQCHGRLRMAARAIVDIDVHRGAVTLDAATAFYHEGVGMSREASRAEAVKNSMFPGGALMYLVGTELIHALRRDLAARDGAAFTLRAFHDRFLAHGSVPVALIATAMREPAATGV